MEGLNYSGFRHIFAHCSKYSIYQAIVIKLQLRRQGTLPVMLAGLLIMM